MALFVNVTFVVLNLLINFVWIDLLLNCHLDCLLEHIIIFPVEHMLILINN